MKRWSLVGLAVLCLGCVAYAAGAVQLRVSAKPGDTWSYRTTVTTNQTVHTPQGQQPMKATMELSYRVVAKKRLPNGDMQMVMEPGIPTMTMNGQKMPYGQNQTKPKPVPLVMSPNGKLRPATANGSDQLAAMTSISGGLLPSKPVKVGDTWKLTQDLPVGGSKLRVTSTSKLISIKGGTAMISTAFSAPFPNQQNGPQMKGTIRGTVVQGVSLATGMQRSAVGDISGNGTMVVPAPPAQPGQPAGKPQTIKLDMRIHTATRMVSGR